MFSQLVAPVHRTHAALAPWCAQAVKFLDAKAPTLAVADFGCGDGKLAQRVKQVLPRLQPAFVRCFHAFVHCFCAFVHCFPCLFITEWHWI